MSTIKVAVIPGDGIGKEVMPEGMRCLEAAGAKHDITFDWKEFDWSCEMFLKTGRMMPEDGIEAALVQGSRRLNMAHESLLM